MPYHLKTFQMKFFFLADSRLALCNGNLVGCSVHALQIGKQKSSFVGAGNYHAIALYVQLTLRFDFFHLFEP